MVQERGTVIQCHRRGGIKLSFFIQASNPRFQYKADLNDNCLSEAIENAFPMNTENAIMTWNYVSIPLSYKYDLSYMIDDILKLIHVLRNNSNGNMVIHWLPDTFRCDWSIEWNEGIMKICSRWECTVGNLESILNMRNSVSLSISDFINEWKGVLEIIVKGLENCGYDKTKINGMENLITQCENIKNFGILYLE